MKINERVDILFDYAVVRPAGFTYQDVRHDLDWNRKILLKSVQALRAEFADGDATLACTPQGSRQPWLYQLTGDSEEIRAWRVNRLDDAVTRMQTIKDVAEVSVNTTDGRSVEGRRARIIHRGVGRVLEDLLELEANGTE